MSSVTLPVELWLYIFRLSTTSPLTHSLRATTYGPFETIPLVAQDDPEATKTKSALVLVCKQWQAWATDLLYEDLWMGRREKLKGLLDGVEGKGDQERSCGRWVRRANLPYNSSMTISPRPLEANKILEQCPRLEVLVRVGPFRPDVDLRFEFPTDCPPMPSLKRLDWWHIGEAARTGGINCLGDVLQAAPNLQYLSLGGYVKFSHIAQSPIALSSLTTLRILRLNVLFVRQTCSWSMPALQHLIIDNVEDIGMLECFWERFGEQIRTVELGHSLCYYVYDSLSFILQGCPNLRELNYYVHFTALPPEFREGVTFASLDTVRLHAHPNLLLPPESEEYWKRIEDHFALLNRPCFAALKNVVLHGDWDGVMKDSRYPLLAQPLLDRKCIIERAADY
ncbi:uncharacterized protein LAESUDRAFT_722588 [Laetiporus sulphureus 93-53]|uniref:F-box domain-containing protein n=1 Tax=Laetiporus sulphureus 93-53 TaxID=1314785 RepID=A0A165FZI5_9APHY|nr:uncharacterized protein LAESUDRAFT_722588 [Laetiporus sulphureus 93-53]KZT09623.1 hypothetical protein LAESUDRAFT_722588 [Laetiporus sulphureus 93-53]